MQIIEVVSGQRKAVIISVVNEEDFKTLTKKRYSFSWKSFKGKATIYKLGIEGIDDILGVMGLIHVKEEKRIEIKLLASSAENIGKTKVYDGVAGCLIAFACKLAVREYGTEACVSLVPKTELVSHYMKKYYMLNAGWQLYLEGGVLIKLLKEYFYDSQ